MITSVKILQNYNTLKRGKSVKLKDITLLVGDNGCGKSSLLYAMTKGAYRGIAHVEGDETEFYFFDFEKDNPRTKQPNPLDAFDVKLALTSRFKSHGESNVELLEFLSDKTVNNSVIILDEPETALSMRNQYRLYNLINSCVKRGNRLIVATHSKVLIENVEKVFSVEHWKWMENRDFIKSQES